MDFLANEARRQNKGEDDEKAKLQELYSRYSIIQPVDRPVTVTNRSPRPFLTSFADFWDHFGPGVFTMWRALLLNRRVLLFSSVPIGPLCNHGVTTRSTCSNLPLPETPPALPPLFHRTLTLSQSYLAAIGRLGAVGWSYALIPENMHAWLGTTRKCEVLFYVSVADLDHLSTVGTSPNYLV